MPAAAPLAETIRAPTSGGSARPALPASHSGFTRILPRPLENLDADAFLATVPRGEFQGRRVPIIGGIPLVAKLGKGGMGAVYLGIHPRLKTEVAVKVLSQMLADGAPEAIERFKREGMAAARVKSPFVVGVVDVNEEHGLYYLVMEYVHGPSASECLAEAGKQGQTGLSEETAVEICLAVCAGLAAAHQEGVIHRDIKPANILIPRDRHDRLKYACAELADLGLARSEFQAGSLTGDRQAMGTLGYMAPEQAQNAHQAGKAADVFSLGATLYALLAGRPPFKEESAVATVLATIQKPHESVRVLRPDVSKATEALLEICLNKLPEKRFPHGAALLAALRVCRAALAQGDSAQRDALEKLNNLRSTPPEELSLAAAQFTAPPPARPRSGLWLTAAALVLAAALGLTVLFMRRGADPEQRYRAALAAGRAALDEQHWPHAEAAFQQALAERPGDPDATAGLAEVGFHRDFTALRDSLAAEPLDPATGTFRGLTEEKRKQAFETAARLLKGKPEHEELRLLRRRIGLPETLNLELGEALHLGFVRIRAGRFLMGSLPDEPCRALDEYQHPVQIQQDFYLSKHEVTQAEYERVMGANPSRFRGANRPVESVTWEQAREFCRRLTAQSGWTATLPTEAQWEYACRAGTSTPFSSGAKLPASAANFHRDYSYAEPPAAPEARPLGETSAVGSFVANAWGLYDMHGNVWEWCADEYVPDFYRKAPVNDPCAQEGARFRVLRGGAWNCPPLFCRSACRFWLPPDRTGPDCGFRVVVQP